MSFSKVLVANRGEIAVRVLRTCRELGLTGVAVHSDPDAGALHVRVADEAVPLGGTAPGESYLDIDKVVRAALDTGAGAVHPGYGFLAENATFARAVEEAGLVFIGPPAAAIEVMGEKVAARQVAARADVPLIPGTTEPVTGPDEIRAFGAEHGYPLVIKASYGGGGRGMRTVAGPDEVEQALEAAGREAAAAFGHADVYVERYLAGARHVEVQLFADRHGNAVWLGDRDCSVQRRHQKLVEESPAPGLSPELRTAMGESAVRLARAVDYVGAGTVEYLVEGEHFYFLEMNTRIQVEHPVTEEVLGLDLIAEQLRVAAGDPLSVTVSGLAPRGHAVECRVNAENTAGGLFVPAPGRITALSVPNRPGVRFDSGYEAGDEVQPYYDSMVGKLLAWAPDRNTAIRRLRAVLDEFEVGGVPTTVPAVRAVLDHPDFAAVSISTRWLEEAVQFPADDFASVPDPEADEDEPARDELWVAGRRYVVPFFGGAVPSSNATATAVAEPSRRARSGAGGGGRRSGGRRGGPAGGSVTSPMQGTVVAVNVEDGQTVTEGQVLFVVEAMKMENPVRAAVGGVVTSLKAAPGDVVPAGAVLAVIEPETS
ncbi:biotin carboxylase N-terminal domain-containing protein [Streptomyces sp. NPDC047061]|uniref:acetyl/propionyl/methylcrotonyl-CoA carboxylase subunit alpha n=1 Tax=Streptomyces sp. NPDC047061 TaxID=3154605 RepID=UPI0033F4955D